MFHEIINVHPNFLPEIWVATFKDRQRFLNCFKEYIVSPDLIDGNILDLEQRCHKLNRKRAKHYGRQYLEPQVIYVDRLMILKNINKVNDSLMEEHFYSDIYGSFYTSGMNFTMIFVHNFDNKQISSYKSAVDLFHEMNHAGSFIKNRVDIYKNDIVITPDRAGAKLYTKKFRGVGEIFNEGYSWVVDSIFAGDEHALRRIDPFLSDFPLIDQLFPGTKEAYKEMKKRLILEGKIESDTALSGYYEEDKEYLIWKSGSNHRAFVLVSSIIHNHPGLVSYLRDFIYGGKIGRSAVKIDNLYGQGFFRELLTLEEDGIEPLIARVQKHG